MIVWVWEPLIKEVKVPTFGYDVNTDVFQKSNMDLRNSYSTIRIQGYASLRTARNIKRMKVTDTSFWKTRFDTTDDAGEKLSSQFKVSSDKRNF